MNVLPEPAQLLAFLFASFLLAVTPGPGVAYIVVRSVGQGRGAGLASVLGVALGNFGNALGAALGLAALFATSAWTFAVVKAFGAAYLVWLGLRTLWQARTPAAGAGRVPNPPESTYGAECTPIVPPPMVSWAKWARDGFWVSLLNPKTTVFFAAFLPQFMRPDAPKLTQGILLGAVFVLIAALTDTLYAVLAGWVWPKLQARGAKALRASQWVMGGTFIGLGVIAALTNVRPN